MLSFILFTICLNIVAVGSVFAWVWFVAGKNKISFSEKFSNLEKTVETNKLISAAGRADVEEGLAEIEKSLDVNLKGFKELETVLTQEIHQLVPEIRESKDISRKISDQHEEFHEGMLEKLNKAGELIVGYENFFEMSLAELDELSRFVDVLSKRPAVSSDPDFTSFVRAVQLMQQIISRYSVIASDLKKLQNERPD